MSGAREKTGLVVHGVSGSRHWHRPASPTPIPQVVARGMAAIRQEFADCKAYGGTTVLVVPAVVNKKGRLPRRLQAVTEKHPRADPRRPSHTGSRSPSKKSGTSSCSARSSSLAILTNSRAPGSALTSTWATSSSSATPKNGSESWASESLKFTSRSTAKPKRFDYTLGEKGGEIDWRAVRGALKDVGYDGWITAEVDYGNLEAMKDVVRRMKELLHLG